VGCRKALENTLDYAAYHVSVIQEGLAVASIARDVVVEMPLPRYDNAR